MNERELKQQLRSYSKTMKEQKHRNQRITKMMLALGAISSVAGTVSGPGIANVQAVVAVPSQFRDVPESSLAYPAVMKLSAMGIINKAELFYPNETTTQEEAIIMALKLLGVHTPPKIGTQSSLTSSVWA